MALILFCRYRQPDYSSTVGLFFSLTLNSRHTALHMPAWLPCLNKMKSLNSVPRLTLKPPVAVKEPQPLLLLLNTILLRSVPPPSDLAGCYCFTLIILFQRYCGINLCIHEKPQAVKRDGTFVSVLAVNCPSGSLPSSVVMLFILTALCWSTSLNGFGDQLWQC